MMSEEVGSNALKGKSEFIAIKLFDPVEYPRTITGKGTLIQIYNPLEDMRLPAYWEWEDENKEGVKDVPAGYKVRVVNAEVKFT
ncbi:hypothetical protein KXX46_006057 [Aspergillus fumigatus]|uniref:Uncharacterized protein n=1 Tax=Aspergillus fumigatus TaxID=746128 RepID=A0A9P8N9U4_ASPFM|nr:hypothetical protein KXX68_006037 [Aspergillus fumigatus]KAH1663042.1 hypothetical protein KXX46_006057 [Aspergillus fumigatus]KAH1833093.1 hypothetical protein KXX43_005818 [Aspergillus fumigatus]KAH1892751.1 hypothetical protein KXV57_003708 [Aspergillus fumigatus]KAH1912811.1 hypothetical protein KXW47_006701 [Aspergillus fumigatus]